MASLIAPEYFNNHIAVEGEIIVKSIPNDTGTVLVWNPVTKKISMRTHAEIVSDLNLMTTNTVQDVTGNKHFITRGGSDYTKNTLQVWSYDGSNPALSFYKSGSNAAQLVFNGSAFSFSNSNDTDRMPVAASKFIKSNSDDGRFLTGGGGDYDSRRKEDSWFHSSRDFPSGTLIQTDVDYSQDNGDQFLLELKGNMYGGGLPLDAKIQGYIYSGSIIQVGGYSTLHYFNYVIALNSNGKLCFWIPPMSYWQGFDVKVTVGYGGLEQGRNRVVSIDNSSDPGGAKRLQIDLKHLLSREELISSGAFWEKKGIGAYWALDSDKPIAGFNGNAAQTILSGGLLTSSSYSDSQFIPANGIHSRGLIQTDEGFQNRFYKADDRNRIWSFANADTYGLSYYQGSANALNEGIGLHFGNVDQPNHFFGRSGHYYSQLGINSTSFTTGNKQVLNYGNPSTLYIGNPTINNIIESNNSDIAHFRNGVSGVVWDSHNLDPSTFVNGSALNNYVPYNGATKDINLGTKDLEFEEGGSISKLQNKVRIFNKVYQGYYDDGGHTGILAIKMPQASPEHSMFNVDINIYGYQSQYLGKVNVAFYKYVSGTMILDGSKAIWEVTDNFPTTKARVGIGTDGYVSILLGEADTFWNGYFSFEVAKVEAKYGNYNLDWNVGWSHAIEPNFDLYNTNIITLPSDVVATRSWLTNFANNSYIPRAVQYNDNFNSIGGYATSGVYRANTDAGGVNHLYSPMLHLGAQDTTAQLQIKYNDGTASRGELSYRGGWNGNWAPWRTAWDNVNFKPGDYQTRNTDEIISAAKSYYNRIPFKLKNSSYKSWSIQKQTNNNLLFAPSATKNSEDWDSGNSIEFTDAGQVSSRGFNKIGYNDNYLLTAGGGHRLASDFVSSSNLVNYVNLDTPQNINAKKNFTQGLTVNTNYVGLPVLGQGNNIPSKISSIDETYGMGLGTVSSGQGYIQQQRFDGTANAYDLLLQPSGGNVVVGYNQMDYHHDKLETIGRIVSKGNEMNSVKTYVSSLDINQIVAGHTFNWYDTSWKVGNMRGGSSNTVGYSFELSTDGGAYEEKVRIQTDGNIVTQNYGQAQQWNQAYQWGNHANAGYATQSWTDSNFVRGWENALAVGFSSGLSGGAPYMYHKADGYVFLATHNWANGRFVNVEGQQDITGLKVIKDRARNTGAGWGNTVTSTDYSFLIETKSGSNPDNQYTGSIGFFSNSGAQAGIYVRSNDESGTSMAFATTNLFSAGPQISMTIDNQGIVNHVRNRPTFQGNVIWDEGNLTPSMVSNWNNKFKDLKYVADLNLVSESGIYRQEAPISGFNYTTTLNLNSSDGRQQLTIERGGSGMKFRGSTFNSGNTWGDWRTVWSDLNFTQANINSWNSMANSGIRVNHAFTTITGNGLMVADNINNGGESGIYNEKDKYYLVALQDKYYKYSSTYNGWEGINFSRTNRNIGIGTQANSTHKVNIAGAVNISDSLNVAKSASIGSSLDVGGSVGVGGSVKALQNFRSASEEPNTLFIPDGSLSYLDDEIVNENSRMRLSHAMIEQESGVTDYYSESRMLVIRCINGKDPFILKTCFAGQRILILNTNEIYKQYFEIKETGYSYYIPPNTAIQLFIWKDLKAHKYAENTM
ncbi:hypothetical protein [Chryseobacterium lactis]|uniref:hypothetical protein n=2 Tax=Chryseobacterium lactis TaxID=1241981 RepID=UPI00162709C1|nr:hypothetical protein [Chryseobacterium lactis]